MAIECESVRKRRVWAQVARQWYLKSSNRSPITGRLYAHLAILAHHDELAELFYYGKSLAVPVPFTGVSQSAASQSAATPLIMELFNQALARRRNSSVIAAIVRSHAIIFTGQSLDTFDESLGEITSNLDGHIASITKNYLKQGYYIAISNCIALLGYCAVDNPLTLLLKPRSSPADSIIRDADAIMRNAGFKPNPLTFAAALHLFLQATKIHLLRIGDTNTLSFLHVTLVFIRHISRNPSASFLIFPQFPWTHLLDIAGAHDAATPAKKILCPFPDDFAMQGLSFTAGYFPEDWFNNENVEPETHYLEAESMRSQDRPERVLWLGVQIARLTEGWMGYSNEDGFSVGEKGRECFDHEDEESGDDAESGSDEGNAIIEGGSIGGRHGKFPWRNLAEGGR
ncbi:hypothetical protein ACLOAV_010657 [Pseudogymnoascus australis]